MTHHRLTAALGLVLLLTLASCARDDSPTQVTLTPGTPAAAPLAAQKSLSGNVINNFSVDFDGRTLVGGNTVFTWTVRGTGVEPALSHFMVQLPECAPDPLGFSPTNSVSLNTNPNTGIYGVEWHLNVEADDSVGRQYAITFPGDVPLGEVYSSVISGNETGVGIIPGPCQGYDLGGRVFVDANENGLRDPDEESGIANVIVELIDDQGNIETLPTDAFGDFNFRKLGGTFTVNLSLDGYPGFFNSSLLQSFDATTPLTLSATVPPDARTNDFGFAPQSEEIIYDLESGVLLSDGRSLKFWKAEFRSAAGNGKGKSLYEPAVLLGFLAEVEDLFLPNPYAFTPGQELENALAILGSNSRDPLDELLAELLATELNHVAGRGLIDQRDLQLVLISWGEALVADALAQSPAKAGSVADKGKTPPSALSEAIQIFGLVNTGGGGGIDE